MNWKLIHFYVFTFCRYFIATMMISYAFSKILGTQFTTQPSVYDKSVDALNGFELTWYYYGYSYWYGLLLALLQITSSLLLFFRRTTRLGVILFLTIIVNILLIDFAYDIEGAKGMALALTCMGLYIFFSEFNLYYRFFLDTPPLFDDSNRPSWTLRYQKIKWLYIPLVFIGFFTLIYTLKARFMGHTEFYGTWQSMKPIANIQRLHFEAAQTFKINGSNCSDIVALGQYKFTRDSIFLYSDVDKTRNVDISFQESQTASSGTLKELFLKGAFAIDQEKLTIDTDEFQYQFKRIR